MNKPIIALAGGLLLAAGACTDNPAAPSVDRVVAGSVQSFQSLISGFNAQVRGTTANPAAGAASFTEYGVYMARDVIRPDPNESRFVTEFFKTIPDPSDFVGGAQWTGYYTAIRAGQSLLSGLSTTANPKTGSPFSAADQAAIRGFVRTVTADAYIHLIETRNQNGIVIQPADPNAPPAPIKTKASAMTFVAALLDSANTDFAAAGTSVPFTVPPGYQLFGDYSLTSNLVEYNRALRGKIEVMRFLDPVTPQGSAAAALGFLNAALADAPATPTQAYLNKGPYIDFNASAPESFANPLAADPKVLVTDNFYNSFLPGDLRKNPISQVPQQTSNGFTGQYQDKINTDPSFLNAPVPYFRNAEAYLLRAQAEIALGNLAAATADINVVHTIEGGLTAYSTFGTASAAIDAVLYEYRYSFVFQGFQHLDALLEYGRFNAAYVAQPGIPSPGASDPLISSLPIPQNEKNARNGNVTPTP